MDRTTQERILKETVLLSAQLVHNRKAVTAKLTTQSLFVVPVDRDDFQAGVLHLEDVYGAKAFLMERRPIFEVYAVRGKKLKQYNQKVLFYCNTAEQAKEWVSAIKHILAGVDLTAPLPRRKLLVIVNPFSGTKKAVRAFDKTVKLMLEQAEVEYELKLTQHRNHAFEITQTLDLTAYDGIVSISGDGVFTEILNGLIRHDQFQKATQMPVAVIPAGTGNGLAKSLGTHHVVCATHVAIRGLTVPIDMMRIRQEGRPDVYSFLAWSFGFIPDVDIESERYRWAGDSRLFLYAIQRIINLRKYRAKVRYLPAVASPPPTNFANTEPNGQLPQCLDIPATGAAEQGWKELSGGMILAYCGNVPWGAEDFLFVPYACLSDGCMELVYVDDTLTLTDMLAFLMGSSEAKHMFAPYVHYVKVRAVIFEPESTKGNMTYDGEPMPVAPVKLDVLRGLMSLMVPPTYAIPAWDPKQLPGEGLHMEVAKPASSPTSRV